MSLLDKINNLSKSDFISTFGNVFEKTDWIAKKTYKLKPFNSLEELFSKMIEIFENSKKKNHLEILNAHPDLAIKKKLTADSKKEQNNANLNECSEQEFKEFKKLNEEYKKKFEFPFITAVKGKTRKKILNKFRQRITGNIDLEFKEAKKQVKKIARIRLEQIIKNN
jgi:OHCU decarboxylase